MAIPLTKLRMVSTLDMSEEEWLQWRKKGIGGSDAAAILGLNKYKSAFTVFLEKTTNYTERVHNDAIEAGKRLEPVIAEWFEDKTGLKTAKVNAILQHPEYPFMLANIDRRIVGRSEGLEIKTASEYFKKEWEGDEVPLPYLLQCNHYMAVTGYDAWWIAVLIGGNKLVYKKIERDEEVIRLLIEKEKEFWEQHVEANVPPEYDSSDNCTNYLHEQFRQSVPGEIALPSQAEDLIQGYLHAKEQIEFFSELKKKYENQLKGLLGEYEVGTFQDYKITWKRYEQSRFDSQRFKKDHPDLYAQYQKSVSMSKFTVA